jgi:hypothetical protein
MIRLTLNYSVKKVSEVIMRSIATLVLIIAVLLTGCLYAESPNAIQWTFENPEHDFPQRIIYRLETGDALYARVEGTENGKFNKEEFYLKRNKQ